MMADKNWRDNAEIKMAQQVAKKLNRKAVIILSFTDVNYMLSSYGTNGAICREAGKLADKIYDAMQNDTLWWDELNDELRK